MQADNMEDRPGRHDASGRPVVTTKEARQGGSRSWWALRWAISASPASGRTSGRRQRRLLGLPPLDMRPPWHGYLLMRERRSGTERRQYLRATPARHHAGDAGAQRGDREEVGGRPEPTHPDKSDGALSGLSRSRTLQLVPHGRGFPDAVHHGVNGAFHPRDDSGWGRLARFGLGLPRTRLRPGLEPRPGTDSRLGSDRGSWFRALRLGLRSGFLASFLGHMCLPGAAPSESRRNCRRGNRILHQLVAAPRGSA